MKFSYIIGMVAEELKFWKGFVQTARFLDGWCKPVKTPELQQEIYDVIAPRAVTGATVLDIGSGVCSILYGTVPIKQLTACDPLSPLYELIFPYERFKFPPPAPFEAEALPEDLKADLVHISNALDHCQRPERAVETMLAAVNPGGCLIVCGFENEADAQQHQGMHQWNIELVPVSGGSEFDYDLVITGAKAIYSWPGRKIVVKSIEINGIERRWFGWIKEKSV